MDENLKTEAGPDAAASTEEVTVEAGVSPADSGIAAGTAAATEEVPATVARDLDLNQLHEVSSKEFDSLAKELDVHLHPLRSRHHQIVDLVRAAISRGGTVTAEGFLESMG